MSVRPPFFLSSCSLFWALFFPQGWGHQTDPQILTNWGSGLWHAGHAGVIRRAPRTSALHSALTGVGLQSLPAALVPQLLGAGLSWWQSALLSSSDAFNSVHLATGGTLWPHQLWPLCVLFPLPGLVSPSSDYDFVQIGREGRRATLLHQQVTTWKMKHQAQAAAPTLMSGSVGDPFLHSGQGEHSSLG